MAKTYLNDREFAWLVLKINDIVKRESLPIGHISQTEKGFYDFNKFCNIVYSMHGRTYAEFSRMKDVIVNYYISAIVGAVMGERPSVDTFSELPLEVPNYRDALKALRIYLAQSSEGDVALLKQNEDVGITQLEVLQAIKTFHDSFAFTVNEKGSIRSEITYSLETQNFHRYLANELQTVRFDITSADRDLLNATFSNTYFQLRVGTGGATLTGRSMGYIYSSLNLLEVKKIKVLAGYIPNQDYYEPRIFLDIDELPVEAYATTSSLRNALMLDFDDQYSVTTTLKEIVLNRDREFIAIQNDYVVSVLTFRIRQCTGEQVTTPIDNFAISLVTPGTPVQLTLNVAAAGVTDHGIQTGDYVRLAIVTDINNQYLGHLYKATRVSATDITLPFTTTVSTVLPERIIIEKYQFKFSLLFSLPYQSN